MLQLARCVEIGLPALIILIILSQVEVNFISFVWTHQFWISDNDCVYLVACATIYQYLPHLFKCKRSICEQFAVLFTIAIVWAYAEILTAAGAYDKRPDSTQLSCRTDRSGLISASPWSAHFPFRFPLFQDKNRGYFFWKTSSIFRRVKVPYPLQWGRPSFHGSDAFAMIAASYVAIVEV